MRGNDLEIEGGITDDYDAISRLVNYGLETGLIAEEDAIYARNQILEVMGMDEYEEPAVDVETGELEDILRELLDYAHETGFWKMTAWLPGSF